MTAERIYVVKQRGQDARRLVRAAHPAAVLRYIAEHEYSASVATQDELVTLLGEGVKVEDAKAEQQPPPAT